MRALQLDRLGEPADVLALVERSSPDAGPTTAVVEVAACGLNFSDALLCRGEYQDQPDLPFTPGTEVAGTVVAAPPDRPELLGQRVLGRPLLPRGGLADQAVVAVDRLLPVPDTVDDVTAAAIHVTYQTAWFALHRRAGVQAGEVVLVHAAAGGTGSATVQLALAAGARVIATARGAAKVERCRELGADVVVDASHDDVRSAVLEATGGLGADVVVDPVGGDLFEQSRRCVAFEGRLVVVGFASGRHVEVPATHVFVKNYSVLGLNWPLYEQRRPDLVREAHDQIVRAHAAGHVHPEVHVVDGLEEAAAALTDLAGGRTTGKVVVTP